jgi:hypothetical protein
MISVILREASEISSIVRTTWSTAAPALARHRGGFERQLAGLAGMVRVAGHGGRELLQRARRLLQRAGLLLGALRQLQVALHDLPAGLRDGVGAVHHAAQHAAQVCRHVGQGLHQHGGLVGAAGAHPDRQVAGGDALGDLGRDPQRLDDVDGERKAEGEGQRHHHGGKPEHRRLRGAQRVLQHLRRWLPCRHGRQLVQLPDAPRALQAEHQGQRQEGRRQADADRGAPEKAERTGVGLAVDLGLGQGGVPPT